MSEMNNGMNPQITPAQVDDVLLEAQKAVAEAQAPQATAEAIKLSWARSPRRPRWPRSSLRPAKAVP
jgi:hypothetical protein